MRVYDKLLIASGGALVAGLAVAASALNGGTMVRQLEADANAAIAHANGAPVTVRLRDAFGMPSRHATLSGGEALPDARRAAVAAAVGAVAGIGGVRWADGTAMAEGAAPAYEPGHCQDVVGDLLRTRSIRFEESSAYIAPGSDVLLDEVADALRPCLGSIIAITGHTDSSGEDAGNIALSRERAVAVRDALVARGIPADGMRARGYGSAVPVEGLDPDDPANRRIEFSVLVKPRLVPTPVDTPAAR